MLQKFLFSLSLFATLLLALGCESEKFVNADNDGSGHVTLFTADYEGKVFYASPAGYTCLDPKGKAVSSYKSKITFVDSEFWFPVVAIEQGDKCSRLRVPHKESLIDQMQVVQPGQEFFYKGMRYIFSEVSIVN